MGQIRNRGSMNKPTMATLFDWVKDHPGWSIIVFVGALVVVAALPRAALERLTFWSQSLEWARVVFQVGGILLVLFFGVIPLLKWYQESVRAIVERKPIVLTDIETGRYSIRNVGDSPALDVWIVVQGLPNPIPVGSLDAHQSRQLPASVVESLANTHSHVTLAYSRFPDRPYTPVFNLFDSRWSCYTHAFRRTPVEKASLEFGGSVAEYLHLERSLLLDDLKFHSQQRPPT
jgi:hypothetical protein